MEPLRRRMLGRVAVEAGDEQRGEEAGEIGIVADEEQVLGLGAVVEELLEVA